MHNLSMIGIILKVMEPVYLGRPNLSFLHIIAWCKNIFLRVWIEWLSGQLSTRGLLNKILAFGLESFKKKSFLYIYFPQFSPFWKGDMKEFLTYDSLASKLGIFLRTNVSSGFCKNYISCRSSLLFHTPFSQNLNCLLLPPSTTLPSLLSLRKVSSLALSREDWRREILWESGGRGWSWKGYEENGRIEGLDWWDRDGAWGGVSELDQD